MRSTNSSRFYLDEIAHNSGKYLKVIVITSMTGFESYRHFKYLQYVTYYERPVYNIIK